MSGFKDPVLPACKVDNKPGTEKAYMGRSKVRLGSVAQPNHKMLREH
jgi:hypothetical protein